MNHEVNNNETEHEGSIWQSAVSLGHLVIAVGGIIVSVAVYMVQSERSTEKRFTTLEIRQQSNLDYIVRDQQEMSSLRRETLDKLNSISQEMTTMRIELVKHQAVTDSPPNLYKK